MPEFDDRALFEKLILDGFQAGLSWITILRKRENFRRAFSGFDPAVIAAFGPEHVEALMCDAGIVRNRQKILGTVAGARGWLGIQERQGFARFLWRFVDGRPVQNNLTSRADIRPENETSRAISKALKAEGFNFVGPTIVYAFMQAVGMVNDHLTGCFRPCAGEGHGERRWVRGRGFEFVLWGEEVGHDPREARPAPGSACCPGGGSTSSTPRRSTSRSRTSRTAWRASRAGTGRPSATTSSRSRSTRCWWRRSAAICEPDLGRPPG